ncbi:MAG: hypothetical protein ORN49_07495, partial [Rhodobacteraceae bacterium]|nr:hypothetical protein [Paracoccaceae bacterium]
PAWLAFFLVPFAPMARLEAQLFTSVEVRMVAGPDYAFNSPMDVTNPLFDPASGSLFYCGDGTDRVMKIADPQAASPPEATGIPTGGNQFCAIDAKAGHILAVDQQSGLVTLTRASDLVRLAERQLDPLPEGEIFVTLDPRHDHLLLSSEVTRPAPARPAIRVLTASSLAPVVTFDERPGAQTIDPESGAILFSSFRDRTGISAYDPLTGAPLARAESDARSDRLLVDEKRHRLIVTSPAASRLRLYDLPGLQPAGVLHSMLGGRSLVLDPVRDLLLVASLSGKVQVIDLGSGQILRQYRVGPWLRDMVLDPEAGIAYVASRFGIYRLNYLD